MLQERFSSQEKYLQGAPAEFLDFLVKDEMKKMAREVKLFTYTFYKYCNAQRTQVLYDMRKIAHELFGPFFICPIPTGLFENTVKGHKMCHECSELQALFKFDLQKDKMPKLPPLLYPSLMSRARKLWLVNSFTLVIHRMLFSMTGAANTQGHLWNVTFCNESMIAFAAVIMLFMVSPDTELSAKPGDITNIPYRDQFIYWRRMLVNTRNTSETKAVMTFYNKKVFEGYSFAKTPKEAFNMDEDEDSDAEMNEHLLRLELGNHSDEDESFSQTKNQEQGVGSFQNNTGLYDSLSDLTDSDKNSLAIAAPSTRSARTSTRVPDVLPSEIDDYIEEDAVVAPPCLKLKDGSKSQRQAAVAVAGQARRPVDAILVISSAPNKGVTKASKQARTTSSLPISQKGAELTIVIEGLPAALPSGPAPLRPARRNNPRSANNTKTLDA
ncbi:hypothetical protein C8J56DRAFT_1068604 [Mycena floridula]|nr:hypothetical protein C8J56DRAFT_1068604 [Mycena floridula]